MTANRQFVWFIEKENVLNHLLIHLFDINMNWMTVDWRKKTTFFHNFLSSRVIDRLTDGEVLIVCCDVKSPGFFFCFVLWWFASLSDSFFWVFLTASLCLWIFLNHCNVSLQQLWISSWSFLHLFRIVLSLCRHSESLCVFCGCFASVYVVSFLFFLFTELYDWGAINSHFTAEVRTSLTPPCPL